MKKQENKLDGLLRDRLGQFEVETSPQDWQAIHERLQRGEGKPAGELLRWLRLSGLLLLTLVTGIIIGYYLHQPENQRAAADNPKAHIAEQEGKSIPAAGKAFTPDHNVVTGKREDTGNPSAYTQGPAGIAAEQANTGGTVYNKSGRLAISIPQKSGVYARQNREGTTLSRQGNIQTALQQSIYTSKQSPSKTLAVITDEHTNQNRKAGIPELQESLSGTKNTHASAGSDSALAKERVAASVPLDTSAQANRSGISQLPTKPDGSALTQGVKRAISMRSVSSHLRLYAGFAVENSKQALSRNEAMTEQVHEDYYNIRCSQEKPALGYTFQAGLEFRPLSRISIQAGIGLKRVSQSVNYNFKDGNIPVIDSASRAILGYIQITDTVGVHYSHSNNYDYVTIPLQIGYYQPVGSRFNLGFRLGVNLMYLNKAEGQLIRHDDLMLQSVSDMKILRNSNMSFTAGLEAEYKVNSYLYLGVGASYQQMQKSMYVNGAPVATKGQVTGIQLTTKFSLF